MPIINPDIPIPWDVRISTSETEISMIPVEGARL